MILKYALWKYNFKNYNEVFGKTTVWQISY